PRPRKASRNGNQFLTLSKKMPFFSLREEWHFWVISHPLFSREEGYLTQRNIIRSESSLTRMAANPSFSLEYAKFHFLMTPLHRDIHHKKLNWLRMFLHLQEGGLFRI